MSAVPNSQIQTALAPTIVGTYKFGANSVFADSFGKICLQLKNGGLWEFDLREAGLLRKGLQDFVEATRIGKNKGWRYPFYRSSGLKVIEISEQSNFVISEGGIDRSGYWWVNEIPALLAGLDALLSDGCPFQRYAVILSVDVVSKNEKLLNIEEIPLDNRHSSSEAMVQKKVRKQLSKVIVAESTRGIGFSHIISLSLEDHFGMAEATSTTEEFMVEVRAQPRQRTVCKVVWKEVTRIGKAKVRYLDGSIEEVKFSFTSAFHAETIQSEYGSSARQSQRRSRQ